MVAADLEVLRVVARGDLERAGAEVGLDALVGDDRHAPLDERHDRLLADQVAVALVVGVHGDRDVGGIVAGRTVAIAMCPEPSASG